MKELDRLRRERNDIGVVIGRLDDIAAQLGGEVIDGKVVCPSPGKPRDDRSCVIRIDPARPEHFFVYACDGSEGAAYAAVRRALRLNEPDQLAAFEKRQAALKIWNETVPARDSLVERYLASRAITIPPPDALRFHPDLYHRPSRSRWPAMVAARTDAAGGIVAIHRTYLRHDGCGKAPVELQRMELGSKAGTAIRLAPVADELMIGEGIETTLSVMQETDRPGWAAGSANDLRCVTLPPSVRSVIILADEDAVGRKAANDAARRFKIDGRKVRIAYPGPYKDFNDMLMAGG
jgi:hypothetical protein